jgi:DNA-binding transcriptional regulator LsrR (DeoR family)
MIPLDKKRDVFILWFIKRHTKREISRKVNLSRGTVDKIINECQERIGELNLTSNSDLFSHLDKIVIASSIQRERKPYKLTIETISFIEEMVINNEKLARFGSEDARTIKELFEDFQKQKKGKPNLMTDFTIDYFYKLVRKTKNKIHEEGI